MVPRNLHEAKRWLHKAATRGNAEAQLRLGGILHESGIEGEQNEGRSWIERAAQHGLPEAQDKLGMVHETGSNTAAVNYAAAKACYMRAAEQGFAPAQVHLASIFERLGDRAMALHWFQRAADAGSAAGLNGAGLLLEAGGDPLVADPKEAVKLYQQAAAKGLSDADFNLGHCFQKGVGITPDLVRAYECYERAAFRGHSAAQNNLGVMLEKGIGIARNVSDALRWYRQAAAASDPAAQCNLGW